MASSILLLGCGSGEEPASGPRVSGDAIAAEGAHEHGAARMGLAVDGMRVTLDLETPGDAIFGFEHPPATEDERRVVTDALARVRAEAGTLVALDPALGCTVSGVEILEAPDIEETHAEEGDGHDHDEEAHDGDGHDHDEEAHDGDEHQHSEMRARVTWSCTSSPEGSPASLRLASLLPNVESVDLTVITSRGQAAARVAPNAAFSF